MQTFKEKLKSSRKKQLHLTVIAAAAVLLVMASVYTLVIKPSQSGDKYIYKESAVTKGNLVKGIMESGTVSLKASSVNYDLDIDETETSDESSSSTDETDDSTSTHYLKIEDVYATPGQRISKGDKLFKLASDSIEAVRRTLAADKADAEIALEEAQAEYNVNVLAAKGTQNSSAASSSSASALYNATVSELQAEIASYTAEIQNKQEEVTQFVNDRADDELWTAEKETYTAMTTAKNTLDATSVNDAAAYVANYDAYTKAKTAYDNAVDAIDKINDSITDDNKTIMSDKEKLSDAQAELKQKTMQAKQTYETSVANGKAAGKIYGYTVDSLKETVDKAQTTLDDASDTLSDLETFVGSDGIIRSDGAGLVTAVNYEKGDKLTKTGTMLSYAKDGAYTVSVDVSEEDVSSITIGDKVSVVFTAYPDKTYTGTVSEISTTAASTHQTTVSYPVTVEIDGNTSKLYGGMTADVTFVTDEVKNVLYVSRKAITYDSSDNAFVYVRSGNSYKLSPVTVGFTDGTSIEIKSGLKEGDKIYIASKISGSEDALKDTSADPESATAAQSTEASGGSNERQNIQQMPENGNSQGGMPGGNGN